VVLAPKPVISDDTSSLEPHVLSQLLAQLGSLASVYHKPADTFVSRQRLAVARADELQSVQHKFVDDDVAAAGEAAPAVRQARARRPLSFSDPPPPQARRSPAPWRACSF
jgi:hypothetical protein